jgi:hypothetical protein
MMKNDSPEEKQRTDNTSIPARYLNIINRKDTTLILDRIIRKKKKDQGLV